MTDPRWTIDEDGLVRWRDLHAVAALNEDNDDCFEAYDALVAAVRDAARIPQLEADADTLRQARELAQTARSYWQSDAEITQARNALLTLLSSPVPDTGEET